MVNRATVEGNKGRGRPQRRRRSCVGNTYLEHKRFISTPGRLDAKKEWR